MLFQDDYWEHDGTKSWSKISDIQINLCLQVGFCKEYIRCEFPDFIVKCAQHVADLAHRHSFSSAGFVPY
jgi:hypothetical protein